MKRAPLKWLSAFAVLWVTSAELASAAFAQFGRSTSGNGAGEESGFYDYVKEYRSNVENEIDSPQDITQTPLFDNLPFLQLKPGDKIVKGFRRKNHRAKPLVFKGIEYFVLSGGRYYRLANTKLEAKSNLVNIADIFLFDWPFNLQSATQIYQAFEDNFGSEINVKKLPKLKAALKKEFPASLLDAGAVETAAPRVIEKGKIPRAVFESLRYNQYQNIVFRVQIEIGNGVLTRSETPIIVGPRHVEPIEFTPNDGNYNNTGGAFYPDDITVARKRGEYNRMLQFENNVNKFLIHPPRRVRYFKKNADEALVERSQLEE